MTSRAKAKQETVMRDVNDDILHQLTEESPSVGDGLRRGPSFGISEGTRAELERDGHAVCPFTGRSLTKEDL